MHTHNYSIGFDIILKHILELLLQHQHTYTLSHTKITKEEEVAKEKKN